MIRTLPRPACATLCAAAILTLTGTSPAQSRFPAADIKPASMGYPTGSQAAERVEVGFLSDDDILDGVVLFDDVLRLNYGAAYFVSDMKIQYDVSDFDILPGMGTDGADAVLYTDDTGLRSTRLSGGYWQRQLIDGSLADSTHLHCVDLDASGSADVVGLEPDGVTVFMVHDAGLAGQATTSFTHSATIHDLVPLDYSASAGLEIACITASGLVILDQSGTTLYSSALGAQGDLIEVLPESNGTLDELVMVLFFANKQWLWVAGDTYMAPIGNQSVTALEAGDVDQDGLVDVVATAALNQPVVFYGQAADPSFSAATSEFIEVANPQVASPGNLAHVCLADLDNDGDLDVLYGEDLSAKMWFAENSTIDGSTKELDVLNLEMVFDGQTDKVLGFFLHVSGPSSQSGAECTMQIYESDSTGMLAGNFIFAEVVETLDSNGDAALYFAMEESYSFGDPELFWFFITADDGTQLSSPAWGGVSTDQTIITGWGGPPYTTTVTVDPNGVPVPPGSGPGAYGTGTGVVVRPPPPPPCPPDEDPVPDSPAPG